MCCSITAVPIWAATNAAEASSRLPASGNTQMADGFASFHDDGSWQKAARSLSPARAWPRASGVIGAHPSTVRNGSMMRACRDPPPPHSSWPWRCSRWHLPPPRLKAAPAPSGATTRATTAPPRYSSLDQINKDNVSRLKVAWRRPHLDRQPPGRRCARAGLQQLPGDAHRWWAACSTPRMPSAWSKPSIPAPARRCGCRRPAQRDCRVPAIAAWRTGRGPRGAHHHVPRVVALRAGSEDGRAHPLLRHRRGGRSQRRSGPAQPRLSLELRAAGRPRRDRHGLGDGRSGLRHAGGRRPRRRARLRCPHRQAAVDVSRDSRSGRSRAEDLER